MKLETNLSKYYINSTKTITFYAIEMKKTQFTISGILEKLDISYMAYKRAKENYTNASVLIEKKLEAFLGYNSLDEKKIVKYEQIINEIIVKSYYRTDDTQKYLATLDLYIADNNYLKPIFELLKICIFLNSNIPFKILKEKYGEALLSLAKYKDEYFITPFKEIYILIENIFSSKIVLHNDHVEESLKGLVYYSYTCNAYNNKDFSLALYYSDVARKYLINDYNFNRYITISFLRFSCLNYMGEYEKVYEEALKLQYYITKVIKNNEFEYFNCINIFISMLGLEKYQELNDLIAKKDVMDDSDYIFLIIATYASNKKDWEKLFLEYQNKQFKDSYLNYNISLLNEILQNMNILEIEKLTVNEALKRIITNMIRKTL